MSNYRGAVTWSWSQLGLGAVYALPAAALSLRDPEQGLALAVGALPAAALGLRPQRRDRALVIVIGVLAGASMILGSLIAGTPVLAVATVFALCVVVATAVSMPARRLAPLALALGVLPREVVNAG